MSPSYGEMVRVNLKITKRVVKALRELKAAGDVAGFTY